MPMQLQAEEDKGAVKPEVLMIIALILILILLWCLFFYKGGRKGGGGPQIKATAYEVLPSGCPQNAPPRDTTQLRACLQGLTFDTVPAIGDEQRLMIRGTGPGPVCRGDTTHSCRYGPLAKIEPVIGAHDYTDSALAEGRVIARMFIRAAETDSYPKLGLVLHDTTYWYVNTTMDSSFYVSRTTSDSSLAAVTKPLEIDSHPGAFQQAVARWFWDENDEKAQGTCGQGCCR